MVCWTVVLLLSEGSMYALVDQSVYATARYFSTVYWVDLFTQAVVTTLHIAHACCAVWDIVRHMDLVPLNISDISFWWTEGCGEK